MKYQIQYPKELINDDNLENITCIYRAALSAIFGYEEDNKEDEFKGVQLIGYSAPLRHGGALAEQLRSLS